MLRTLDFGLLIALLMLIVAPVSAQNQLDEALLTDFEAFIRREMDYFGIPGAAVAIIEGDQIVYSQGFGVRNLTTGDLFTAETLFRVGSTTKSMTSLLVAQLVDEGVLTWDTPVAELFPMFATAEPALAQQVTVGDLMSMATGLESSVVNGFYWGDWDVDALLSAIATQEIGGDFREHYSYNNEVYALAGYAAAVAAGEAPTVEAYAALMQARVFDPIGITSAIITDDENSLGDDYSRSYEPLLFEDGFQQMSNPPIGIIAPAGATWMHIGDMARYVITQMNGGVTPEGTRIVSADALAETWRPGISLGEVAPGITETAYGMGWVTQTYQRVPIRYHDGGWAGYNTQMFIYPDNNKGLVVFANAAMGALFGQMLAYTFAERLNDLEARAVDLTHDQYESLNAQIEAVRTQISVEIDDASALIGSYADDWFVEQRADGSVWLMRSGWEFRMGYIAATEHYVLLSGGALGVLASLEADAEGSQLVLQLGEAGELRLEKLGS